MSEVWKPIPGWEGKYAVSSMGRIKGPRGLMKTRANPTGYQTISLPRGNGKQIAKTVHSLVMAAHVGPRPEGMHVCHLDHNRSNNRLENLRYGSKAENTSGSIQSGRYKDGPNNHYSKLSLEQVLEIVRLNAAGTPRKAIADQFGIERTTVNNIVLGKTWSRYTGIKGKKRPRVSEVLWLLEMTENTLEWYASPITYSQTQLKHPQSAISADEGKKARACLDAIRKNREAK